jgi:hypothetical protein
MGKTRKTYAEIGPRSRLTTDPLCRLDKKRHVGRRVVDLYHAFMNQMGNPTDPVSMAHAMTAAELRAMAEDGRSRLINGDTKLRPETVLKLEGFASRAEKKLKKAAIEQPKKLRPLVERLALRKSEASA